MKVVLFCGGRGTRLNEETEKIPKPLIKLADGNPLIWHIMSLYSHYGFDDFVLCLGYKKNLFPEHLEKYSQFNITFLDTGLNSGTAERLKRTSDFVTDTFFVTYGDGISNINISQLLNFHSNHGKIGTVSAVRPLVRFGKLELDRDKVKNFRKYESPKDGWIDGGFFVFNKQIFSYLNDIEGTDMLEGEPLESLSSQNQLNAFRHEKYWQCVDTYRDLLKINKDLEMRSKLWL